jgi:hypothetical protein
LKPEIRSLSNKVWTRDAGFVEGRVDVPNARLLICAHSPLASGFEMSQSGLKFPERGIASAER